VISWIVASHRPAVLKDNLLATLRLGSTDQLIVIHDPVSIARAYADAQDQATQPIRCYIHHDVLAHDSDRLRNELLTWCSLGVGMVGLIGSRDRSIPWWNGALLGSVLDARLGPLNYGTGGPCSMLDGLLLATAQKVDWDLTASGFHGYDADACAQMLALGLQNWCLTGGHEMVTHNTSGPQDPDIIDGFDVAVARHKAKWGPR
jgi:hypothetical protein